MLRLTPTEFQALTVTEFHAMAEARAAYEHATELRWRQFFAAMTANLMNASGNMQHTVQPEDLVTDGEREALYRAQAQALAAKKVTPAR